MRFSIAPTINLFIAFLIFASLNINSSFAQSSSDYLKLLEGEASNSTIDTKTQAKEKKTTKLLPATTLLDGKIPLGLSKEEFMLNLKANYIGTYFFAKRLSKKQQNEIYTFYQNNNDPQAIRSQVIIISKQN